jgi:hypothetical protein
MSAALLSPERVAEIAARADAATMGPWHPGHLCNDATPCNCPYVLSDVYCGSVCTIDVSNGIGSIADGDNDSPPLEEAKANQRFIAHARQDIPDLLAHIAALTQEIDVRKRYGHFCCSAHAEAALAEKRATGTGPWERIGFATLTPDLSASTSK